MKATQLEKIKADYQNINEQSHLMHDILGRRKDTLKLMQTSVTELESEYKDLEKLRSLEADISKLKDKLVWALIQEREEQVEELLQTEKELETQMQKCVTALAKVQVFIFQ